MLFTELLLTGSAHAFIQTFCQEEVQQYLHAVYRSIINGSEHALYRPFVKMK